MAGKRVEGKLPIVYSDNYNMGLLGLQKLHPFDTQKFRKVHRYLLENAGLQKSNFHRPVAIEREGLLEVHSVSYLDSLRYSEVVAQVAELPPLGKIPNFLLQSQLLKPMRYATGGSILGAKLAMEHGWAINLSGGYHHAKAGNGEGFCFFADIPLSIYEIWKTKPDARVLVVDLDAHQGNGVEAILQDDPRFFMMDVYNGGIYPQDHAARQFIDYDFPLNSFTSDEEYLECVRSGLAWALHSSRADLIIYNAGTDIYEKDLLGQFAISEAGILKRDQMVFEAALGRNTPILMLLSGGYAKESGTIIGRSIVELLKSFGT